MPAMRLDEEKEEREKRRVDEIEDVSENPWANAIRVLAKIDGVQEEMHKKLADLSLLQDLQVEMSRLSEEMHVMRKMQERICFQTRDSEEGTNLNGRSSISRKLGGSIQASDCLWQLPECVNRDDTVMVAPHFSVRPDLQGTTEDGVERRATSTLSFDLPEELPEPSVARFGSDSPGNDSDASKRKSDKSFGLKSSCSVSEYMDNVRSARRLQTTMGAGLEAEGSIHSPGASRGTLLGQSRSSRIARIVQLHPDSIRRSVWDIFSCFALVFDSLMIPYMIAWAPDVEGFVVGGMFFTAIFWIADVFVTLNTSYFTVDGELEQRPARIFYRYFRTTLILDLVICGTDWVGLAMELSKKNAKAGGNEGWALIRVIKINRVFRIAGVLRVSRLMDSVQKFNQMFLSNTWQVLAQVVAICIFVLWLNHILCCTWYAIGNIAHPDTGQSWLDAVVNSKNGEPVRSASIVYQYTTAYHWSISQLTPGSMQVVPMNSTERIANILYLVFGLLFCTFVTSRLSALMVQLQIARQAQAREIMRLRTFLRQQKVHASLAQRVERSVISQLKAKKPLSMNDIPSLNAISRSLRNELKLDIFMPRLLREPVFSCMANLSSRIIQTVCEAVDNRQLAANEELFATGTTSRTSYIFLRGCLTYTMALSYQSEVDESANNTVVTKVTAQTWISSAAFLMTWTTQGHMEAEASSDVLVLDALKILPLIFSNFSKTRVGAFVKHYSDKFRTLVEKSTDVASDLEYAVDHALVVWFLPDATRKELCHQILEQIKNKSWLRWGSGQALKDLENEISLGKCTLITKSDGLPIRVAIVVALRLRRPSGAILVQVGNIKDAQYHPVCRLPGTKLIQSHGEFPSQAAARLLAEVLDDLQSSDEVELGNPCEVDIEEQPSPTYDGLITQYRRSIFEALIDIEDTAGEPPRIENLAAHSGDTSFNEKFAVVNFLAPASIVAAGRSFVDKRHSRASSTETSDVLHVIKSRNPWLENHCPQHLQVAMNSEGKGCVYAWIHPDDFEKLKSLTNAK